MDTTYNNKGWFNNKIDPYIRRFGKDNFSSFLGFLGVTLYYFSN